MQQRYALVCLHNNIFSSSLHVVFIKESGVRPLESLVQSHHQLTDIVVQQDDLPKLYDPFVLRLSTDHHRL